MLKRVDLDKVDKKVKEFLKGLNVEKDQYILEMEGKPVAGLVAPSQLEKMARAKERLFETIEKIWDQNREVSAEQVERDVAEAVRMAREQRYEKSSP